MIGEIYLSNKDKAFDLLYVLRKFGHLINVSSKYNSYADLKELEFSAMKNDAQNILQTMNKKSKKVVSKLSNLNKYRNVLSHTEADLKDKILGIGGQDTITKENFFSHYLSGLSEVKYFQIIQGKTILNFDHIFGEETNNSGCLVRVLNAIMSYLNETRNKEIKSIIINEIEGQNTSNSQLLENKTKPQEKTPQELLNKFLSQSSASEKEVRDKIRIRALGYAYALDPLQKTELSDELAKRGHNVNDINGILELLAKEVIKDTGNHYLPKNIALCKEAADKIQDEIIEILTRQ